MAKEYGFKKYFLTGHLGKLVKIAGGAKNTHSKYGDGRMQLCVLLQKNFAKKKIISCFKKKSWLVFQRKMQLMF